MFLSCCADYEVAEYILGSGGAAITVSYDRICEARSYELYARAHGAGEFGDTDKLSSEEYGAHMAQVVSRAEALLREIVREGRVWCSYHRWEHTMR